MTCKWLKNHGDRRSLKLGCGTPSKWPNWGDPPSSCWSLTLQLRKGRVYKLDLLIKRCLEQNASNIFLPNVPVKNGDFHPMVVEPMQI